MMDDVTVILNAYQRPQFLDQQLNAVRNQTHKPFEIMLWKNGNCQFDPKLTGDTTFASCNRNLGVWARFAFALNAKTKYVCVFDDDTIPGSKWIENCVNTIKIHRGLLGTVGLIYNSPNSYFPNTRIGWPSANQETIQVDIVGHCWFFERDWLCAFWRELPPPGFDVVGEDMHFSHMLQKHLGINTYVPPHPRSDLELWGSLKGWEFGTEGHALSLVPANTQLMDTFYKHKISEGFSILKKAL